MRKIKEEGGVGWRMNQEQVEGNIARAVGRERKEKGGRMRMKGKHIRYGERAGSSLINRPEDGVPAS